jgi:GNAT superfamily N-acetyltransferase
MDDIVRIERRDLTSADAQALIAALNAELSARYPEPGANHFRLDPNEVAPGRGAFLVAYRGDEAVGCGAVRLIGDGDAEIKRMLVVEAARGLGFGRRLAEALEEAARELGATRLVLETGIRQPEAIGLYESTGFEHIEPFGEYVGSAFSVCMAKAL